MDIDSVKNAFGELFHFKRSPAKKLSNEDTSNEVKSKYSPHRGELIQAARSSNYNTDLSGGGYSRSSVFVLDIGKNDFSRSSGYFFDLSRSWWMSIPLVLRVFLNIFLLPINLVRFILDFTLSFFVVGIIGVFILWVFGVIPDSIVADNLIILGDRLLSIVQKMGLPI